MIVVASTNGMVGIREAMRLLRAGRPAVEAVEAGVRLVEANPDDHTVGYGGYPNLLGQVELDAAIMDGRELAAGAVGALQGYRHPISVARLVMERLPHVFLVADGAARFAAEVGCEPAGLLTDEAARVWQKGLPVGIAPAELAGRTDLWQLVEQSTDPEKAKGTINFIAQEAAGDICVGVSTSGWAWKYPGRLGDSPLVGAGLYADNRYGAAACTGMGEMAIRAATAHSVVMYLKMGLPLAEAGRRAMEELNCLGGRYLSDMSLVALDANGNHAGLTNVPGKTYLVMTAEMDEPAELPRTFIHTEKRWPRQV